MTEDNNTQTELLSVEDAARSFGPVSVLEGVSLSLSSGTLSAVIGPNGAGKTTLLRLLTGTLSPTAGTRIYHGPDVSRPIGYLPQQPAFRPSFSALETLDFYASFVDGDSEAALSRVGLADAADRRVEALSGGMTRLLGLAQATIGNPPIVILDEPGSGLDPRMRRRTFEVARELADDGAAVLLSSHDISLVEEWADHVFMLSEGTIIESDAPQTLCDRHGVAALHEVFDSVIPYDDQVAVLGVSD